MLLARWTELTFEDTYSEVQKHKHGSRKKKIQLDWYSSLLIKYSEKRSVCLTQAFALSMKTTLEEIYYSTRTLCTTFLSCLCSFLGAPGWLICNTGGGTRWTFNLSQHGSCGSLYQQAVTCLSGS